MASSGIMSHILRQMCAFVLSFFSIFSRCFKKLICRTRRGRKNSGSLLPMTTDHITTATSIQQSVPSNPETELQSWDSWGADDAFNQANGDGGRHRKQEPEPEPDIDFFQDMTPAFKKAAKIKIRKKEDNYGAGSGFSSRLAFTSDVPVQDGELGSWEESENAWGDELSEDLSWEAQEAIKERKRLDRERRQLEQQRRKMQRDSARVRKDSGGLPGSGFQAVKLS